MKVGDSVGHYQVIAKLGRGGQGDVWLAEHPAVGKRVAVKVIDARRAARGAAEKRFLDEARAVAAIAHPNVVALYDYGKTDAGDLYFTMERLDGRTLASLVDEVAPLPISRALAIAAQVADALGAAHARGVIHRDLSPANVFLVDSERVKVLDFGLARRMDATTGEGAPGTPAYMAPEQCAGRRDLDGRADVYALGCLLHEMLTGRPPFVGEAEEVARAHVERPPSLDGVPLASLLARFLAKDPAARFPSMAAARDALTEVNAVPTLQVPPRRRRRWPFAVAVALLALALAPVALRARRHFPSTKAKTNPVARWLRIRSAPAGARVTVDGAAAGLTPVDVPLDGAARGDVALALDGYAPWRGTIDPARDAVVEAILVPLPARQEHAPTRRAPPTAKPPASKSAKPEQLGDGILPPSL